MAEYRAQLLAVEAKLTKDPDNEELLSLKADLKELLEGLEEQGELEEAIASSSSKLSNHAQDKAGGSRDMSDEQSGRQNSGHDELESLVGGGRRKFSDAELLARKKEKNKKKKAKLRERVKEQLDIAENDKKSWQSFASKKGLKGVTKKSIFASPCSVTGKVGVGTNGIADAASAASTTMKPSAGYVKRKY